jgi:hypothetical protein
MRALLPAIILVISLIAGSCDKGYRLRFANYHTEQMDSVIVGTDVMFVAVEPKQVTEFKKIRKGTHAATCITASKRKIYATVQIPSRGSGDRTLQVDGVEQVSVLEE